MAAKRARRIPSYRHHKPSNQAFVELDAKRIYLGRHGTPKSEQEYHRVVAEWIANGYQLPSAPSELTILELLASFWRHAQQHYRHPDGSPTSEQVVFRHALRPLRELYETGTAGKFGPRSLKAVRQHMIDLGWARTNINKQINRIKHVFKWGVENELVPPQVYQGLQAVAGLRRGRTTAHETDPVQPVPEAIVDGTLPHLTPTLRAMVELQQLTGMRPGEICIMRGCDLDTSGTVWVYQPESHKTQHYGRNRLIFIGPKGQEILKPFLRHDLQAYLFSPAQSDAERRAERHSRRKTPMSCGNIPGSNRTRSPRRKPGDRYTTQSYGRAIGYACRRAFPIPKDLSDKEAAVWRKGKHWSPNQLRHSFATQVRRDHGLEAAQVLLGHATANVTQVYAERDVQKAAEVAAKVG